MQMTMSEPRPGSEFNLIQRHFAPLSAAESGAFVLRDDAASLAVASGHELVITKDMMVAGVHFFADDPPGTLSRKILRANLSDLAAMGATPRAYALGLALPDKLAPGWLEDFCAGLAADQAQFGVTLIGGDTIAAPDSLTLSLTAFGEVPAGRALRRSGANGGDDIYVSGTIGDASLGLLVARGQLEELSPVDRGALIARYQMPLPRTKLGQCLLGRASAAIDISDGLVADLGHICAVSQVGAQIEAALVPLSAAAKAACSATPSLLAHMLTGGDDYELMICAPTEAANGIVQAACAAEVPLTRIGTVMEGSGVRVLAANGEEMRIEQGGYRHF